MGLINDQELLVQLHIAIEDAGSVHKLADAHGIERKLIFAILRGDRRITSQVASAIGYRIAGVRLWERVNNDV